MKLKIDFYADTFRGGIIEVPDEWDKLPPCECVITYGTHSCRRGQLIESMLNKYGKPVKIITCKRIKEDEIFSEVKNTA